MYRNVKIVRSLWYFSLVKLRIEEILFLINIILLLQSYLIFIFVCVFLSNNKEIDINIFPKIFESVENFILLHEISTNFPQFSKKISQVLQVENFSWNDTCHLTLYKILYNESSSFRSKKILTTINMCIEFKSQIKNYNIWKKLTILFEKVVLQS